MMIRVFILLIISLSSIAFATDLSKEQRWADQVVDSILDGDAVWLEADNQKFLSIYTPSEEESEKALIIMHGTGVHRTGTRLYSLCRVEMTARGWHTISLQMPVLANEASQDDYAPLFFEVPSRMDASIAYLLSNGIQEIVLVGHSLGSLMTSFYLSNSENHAVKGFVAIGMSGGSIHDQMNSLKTLAKVRVPVLDLYGSNDLPEVLENIQAKKQAASEAGIEQIEVKGANHFFDDYEEQLVNTVEGWLNRHF